MLLRQFAQPHTLAHLKSGVAIAHQHAATLACVLAQKRSITGDVSGLFKPLQVALPPVVCLLQVLLLQPADVIAIAWRRVQLRAAALAQRAVDFEEIAHQQRATPGVDQDVVVAHHEPVTRRAQTNQTQVKRRVLKQIETGFTLTLEQGLQTRFMAVLRLSAPVQIINGRVAGAMDDLQHVFTHVPAKRRTQGFMPGHNCLPGLRKTLGVERTVDAITVLHVIQPRARFQQGMQQHALLHWGHGVHVFNVLDGHGQGIKLRLIELGQREVRWRQATRLGAQTMLDQALQFLHISRGQDLNGLRGVALGTERPAQQQLAAIHLTVNAQLIGQGRLWIMGDAH